MNDDNQNLDSDLVANDDEANTEPVDIDNALEKVGLVGDEEEISPLNNAEIIKRADDEQI
jgi:hypothetical protein